MQETYNLSYGAAAKTKQIQSQNTNKVNSILGNVQLAGS